MTAILTSGSVLVACIVIGWAFAVRSHVRAKDIYVDLFTKTASDFLQRPELDERFKRFLIDIAPGIQERKIANYVAKAVADGASPESDFEIQRMMDGAENKPTEEQMRFLAAMFFYLMALSFSSPRYGGQLRRRLRPELADKSAMMREGQRVYQARAVLGNTAVSA